MATTDIKKFPASFLQFKHLYWIEPFNNRLDGDDFSPIRESEVEVEFKQIKGEYYIHFTFPCWPAYGAHFPIAMYWRKQTKAEIKKYLKEAGKGQKETERKLLAKIKKEFIKDLNISKAWAIKLRKASESDDKKRDAIWGAFIHEMNQKLKKL